MGKEVAPHNADGRAFKVQGFLYPFGSLGAFDDSHFRRIPGGGNEMFREYTSSTMVDTSRTKTPPIRSLREGGGGEVLRNAGSPSGNELEMLRASESRSRDSSVRRFEPGRPEPPSHTESFLYNFDNC